MGTAWHEVGLDFPREWVEFTDPAGAEHVVRADLTWALLPLGVRVRHARMPGHRGRRTDDGCRMHGAFLTDKATGGG